MGSGAGSRPVFELNPGRHKLLAAWGRAGVTWATGPVLRYAETLSIPYLFVYCVIDVHTVAEVKGSKGF